MRVSSFRLLGFFFILFIFFPLFLFFRFLRVYYAFQYFLLCCFFLRAVIFSRSSPLICPPCHLASLSTISLCGLCISYYRTYTTTSTIMMARSRLLLFFLFCVLQCMYFCTCLPSLCYAYLTNSPTQKISFCERLCWLFVSFSFALAHRRFHFLV